MKVGRDAAHLALDTASNTAYVANREDHTISMIDTTSNTVVATVDPRTQNVYVTDSERGTVIVLAGRR
ncbi:YncE family protein [Nocardia salmonicida]|uniref:YncE family protein n=1 Tax=Nocardia salmonicida TaxID=53431 RepID=UPI0036574372